MAMTFVIVLYIFPDAGNIAIVKPDFIWLVILAESRNPFGKNSWSLKCILDLFGLL